MEEEEEIEEGKDNNKEEGSMEEDKEEEDKEEENMEEEESEEIVLDLDECQKGVEKDPDNSIEWIKLMQCFIQRKEIDEARKVGKTGIESINFRKLEEKLNIWKALMQLEANHGDEKSLKKVYNEALEVCDRKKIMLHMIHIYKEKKEVEEEEKIFRTLFKKVKGSCKVYKKYCNFLMRNNREEEIKNTLSKAKTTLDKKKMISLEIHIARLEYKYGSVDKGRSMFEDILTNNPKRHDVWNIYIDMEKEVGDVGVIRRIFERIVKQKLSTKTMKTFLTKYLEFERKYGDESRQEHVRDIAKSFVSTK
ncbi:S1 RNA binding domain-containing protein [Entamoeba histolytica]